MKVIDISNGLELLNNKSEIELNIKKTMDLSYFIDKYLDFNRTIFIDSTNNKVVPFSIKSINNENYIYIPGKSEITEKLITILEHINFNFDNLIKSDIQDISLKTAQNTITNYFVVDNDFYYDKIDE